MELSEVLKTIDATAGFLMRIKWLMDLDIVDLGDDKESWILLTEVQTYTIVNPNSEPEFRFNLKYRNGQKEEFAVPNFIPVCHYLIDTWPLAKAKQIRSYIDESNILNLADDILGFNDPMMYETSFELQEYDRLIVPPSHLFDVIYDINYHLAYALQKIEEWEEEERLSFLIHVGITDEEEIKKIDSQLRQLVQFPSFQDILLQLSEMKKANKIMIPPAESLYNELVRLGMRTTGRGFSLKNLKNNYKTFFQ